jgi:CSLREA domain-containing protein
MKALTRSCLLLAGLVTTTAYADTTITVTTYMDENGSNSSACSLREALHVVNDKSKKAWGGCPAASNVGDIIIQLDAALPYELTLGALQVSGSVTIAGKDTVIVDDEDTAIDESLNLYTGKTPNRTTPVTIIDGLGADRIIDSYGATGSGLTLKDLVLRNGNADYARYQGNGGAIYAALSVALDNTRIENSHSLGLMDSSVSPSVYRGGMGGAIYLSKAGVGLSLSNATLQGNQAEGSGGALAMVCEENLDLAGHSVTISNSLIASNSSTSGAGAIQGCGSASLTLSNATLAKSVSATGSAALSFLPTREGQGSVSLSDVTAAENTGGAALAFGKLSAVVLNNSALLGNAGNCYLATDTSFTNGNYNALDDHSCDALLVPAGSSTYENREVTPGTWANELLALGDHGGLTQVYLPLAALTSHVLDRGQALGSCGTDQRGFPRQSGTACDIGAAERQTPSANADSADSGSNAERAAIIDVLDNDAFGESDNGTNKYAQPAVTVVSTPTVSESGVLRPVCKWYDDTAVNEDYRNRLVIDNMRAITADGSPVSCTYHVNVTPNGGGAVVSSLADATVTAAIKNVSPKAVADVYVRPVGTTSITLNLIDNDTDVDDSNGSLSTPIKVMDINGNLVDKFAVIYISSKPQLGYIEGTTLPCPDNSASSSKTCFLLPVRYVAENSQSPFTDSFQYTVYDEDDAASSATTVTIKTDAPDINNGETGGSLDFAGGLLLALLGLRRARKL